MVNKILGISSLYKYNLAPQKKIMRIFTNRIKKETITDLIVT